MIVSITHVHYKSGVVIKSENLNLTNVETIAKEAHHRLLYGC